MGLLVYNTLKPVACDASIGCIEFAHVNEFAYSVAESDHDNCFFSKYESKCGSSDSAINCQTHLLYSNIQILIVFLYIVIQLFVFCVLLHLDRVTYPWWYS